MKIEDRQDMWNSSNWFLTVFNHFHIDPNLTCIWILKPTDLPQLWKTRIFEKPAFVFECPSQIQTENTVSYLNLPCIFAPKSCKNAGNAVSETLSFKILRCLVPSALGSLRALWWPMIRQGDQHCFHSNLGSMFSQYLCSTGTVLSSLTNFVTLLFVIYIYIYLHCVLSICI